MHALNIALGNLCWQFLFREKEKAMTYFDQIRHSPMQTLSITDDFGQQAVIAPPFNAMLENLDESKMAHVEMALHRHRIQLQAQKQAQTDPMIRSAQLNGGPRVMVPGGLNG